MHQSNVNKTTCILDLNSTFIENEFFEHKHF